MTNILKYKNKIIAVALAFVMVFSVLVFVSPTEAQAVSINATDTGFYNLAYGATGDTTFGAGTQIRVINDTRNGKNKSDAVYKFDGTTWSAVDPNKYIVWDGSSANTFYGVYPYNAEYDKFTIPADQSGGVQDADWMTDDYIGTKGSGNGVDFKFQHRLAKVTVEIADWNSEFDNQTHEITYPIIYSKGTDLTANYNDDGVSITSTGDDIEITPLVDEIYPSYTAIVAPVKYNTNDTFMTFTVKGQEMTVKANGNTTLTEGLQAGYHYTFDLTVGKDAVTLTSVTVNGWVEKDIDGGVAEECTHDWKFITAEQINFALNDDGESYSVKGLKFGFEGEILIIPSTYGEENYPVTVIDEYAFFQCTALTSVTIPDSVTTIGENVFAYTGLTSVIIPDSVTSIGRQAFGNCRSLTSVTFGENSRLQTIGEDAFFNCLTLTSVTIPDSVTSIGDSAFSGTALTSVTIPASVTSIGDMAFGFCSSLTSVEFAEGSKLETIGAGAFAFCESLTSVSIPDSVIMIGNQAFGPCIALTSVEFAEGSKLETIGNMAFEGCTKLTSVTIPDSVTSIGERAFLGCTALTSVEFVEGSKLETIGNRAFEGCTSLTSVIIPYSVTSIGNEAFQECYSLKSVIIPASVTEIGKWAFMYCSDLESVIISDSVTTINSYAFSRCDSLTSVYYGGTEADWENVDKIAIGVDAIPTNATVYYYSENKPEVEGNYWHYDSNGAPTTEWDD